MIIVYSNILLPFTIRFIDLLFNVKCRAYVFLWDYADAPGLGVDVTSWIFGSCRRKRLQYSFLIIQTSMLQELLVNIGYNILPATLFCCYYYPRLGSRC